MKLSALIQTAANVIGIKPSEAKTRARFIREHGFLRSGGRGKGAAEMQPDDLAALLLGFNSFSEPTGAGYALRDMARAKFDFCNWTDLTACEDGLGREEGERSMPHTWSAAPLPTSFGDTLKSDDIVRVLALALASMNQPDQSCRVESLQSESHAEGLYWKIKLSARTSQEAMCRRYIAFSEDSSDSMRFAKSNDEHYWNIEINFRLPEDQQDKRDVTMNIGGDMIEQLVNECADKWEAEQQST